MKITFLIGNGFDLGLGLKSRFRDFFPIYKEKSKNKEERIKQLSDSIEGNYDTWADFEKALGEYTLQFNSENKQNFIYQVTDFLSEFVEYLKRQESMLLSGESDKISKLMIHALSNYYSTANLATDSNIAITKIYTKFISEQHTYNFVNFNYTSLLSKALQAIPQNVVCKRRYANTDKFDKIGKVVHVHGYCDNYSIIGVNDESQIANKELAKDSRFVQNIVKPYMNIYLREGYDRDATNVINESTIICVYGMSLGATDKKWWNLLVQWLSRSVDHQLVIFEYDNQYSSITPYRWFEKENIIIDKLTQYNSNKGLSVENLRSRIHIAIHKNIFQMDLQYKKDDENRTVIKKIPVMNEDTQSAMQHSNEIALVQKVAE